MMILNKIEFLFQLVLILLFTAYMYKNILLFLYCFFDFTFTVKPSLIFISQAFYQKNLSLHGNFKTASGITQIGKNN